MLEKLARSLTEDIAPLLPGGITFTEDDASMPLARSGWTWLHGSKVIHGSFLNE
jgi:hypothetical protein